MIDYEEQAHEDAKEMVDHFMDSICDFIEAAGEVSSDLFNDYCGGDSYHHESHVDKEYRLEAAAQVLHELREYEETDKGLWEGLPPLDAIAAQAAYTYGNAVLHYWSEMIDTINADSNIEALIEFMSVFDVDNCSETTRSLIKAAVEQVMEEL